jgi:hypothetical protein
MDNTDALRTHSFADAIPHTIKQDGRSILHRRCLGCGRDFARGFDGAGWEAVYVGVLRVELLAQSVNHRWLTEECPMSVLPTDSDDRAMRRS